jgi:hypothetical protein
MNEILGPIAGAVEQIKNQPLSVLLVGALIVLGWALKTLEMFPNKFIPISVLMCGAIANCLVGDVGSVDPSQRHPSLVLALQGLLLGFGAWAIHGLAIKRIFPQKEPPEVT